MAQQEKHNRKGAAPPKKRKTEKSYYFDEEAALQAIKNGTIQKQHEDEADKIEYDRTHAFENWKRYSEYEEKHFPGRHQARWKMWDCARRHKNDCNSLDLLRNGAVKEQAKEILPHLNDKQLEALLPLMNENFFVEALSVDDLKEVFEGKRTAKVKNIGAFAYVLKRLSKQGFIVEKWQHQAEVLKMFESEDGILKAKNLSKYLNRFNDEVRAYQNTYSKDDIPTTYKAKLRLKDEIDNLIEEL